MHALRLSGTQVCHHEPRLLYDGGLSAFSGVLQPVRVPGQRVAACVQRDVAAAAARMYSLLQAGSASARERPFSQATREAARDALMEYARLVEQARLW